MLRRQRFQPPSSERRERKPNESVIVWIDHRRRAMTTRRAFSGMQSTRPELAVDVA
jgi:hypothetical protein